MPAVVDDRAKKFHALECGWPRPANSKSYLRVIHGILLPSAYIACLALFLMMVGRSCHDEDGFASLIRIGSKFDERSLDALKALPHTVLPDSAGYDGQFYVQLALSPILEDRQLTRALDQASYRSRRILFSWTAWLLGLGQPAWIIQAYALQNVLFWLGAAVLLLHWLPPTRWFHFFQWAAILFSRGWLDCVDNALLDGPALFLMLLAVWWSERGRPSWGTALLGVSMLGKETNLLAGLVSFEKFEWSRRALKTLAVRALLLVFPLALWIGIVDAHFGVARSAGRRNFAMPFLGWFGKVDEMQSTAAQHAWRIESTFTVLCMIATLVQMTYFVTNWRWGTKWWRLGAPYAFLGLCLGPAVMEGYPGAFTRALLPMLAAYNLSLKPNWKGWLLLLLGNLDVLCGAHLLGVGYYLRQLTQLLNVGS
jgi:hypothetical protein